MGAGDRGTRPERPRRAHRAAGGTDRGDARQPAHHGQAGNELGAAEPGRGQQLDDRDAVRRHSPPHSGGPRVRRRCGPARLPRRGAPPRRPLRRPRPPVLTGLGMPTVSRMTARSVVLSVLLGAHPAWASASELIRLTADFDIKEPTLRVALTRMVGAGDLLRSEDGYRLSDRLLARQRRQDDAMDPKVRPWKGTWTTPVIPMVGTGARARASLRTTLQDKRFAELREGIWLRPDNLDVELSAG